MYTSCVIIYMRDVQVKNRRNHWKCGLDVACEKRFHFNLIGGISWPKNVKKYLSFRKILYSLKRTKKNLVCGEERHVILKNAFAAAQNITCAMRDVLIIRVGIYTSGDDGHKESRHLFTDITSSNMKMVECFSTLYNSFTCSLNVAAN